VKVNINPFNTGNPMTFKDAAVVATIVAFVIWVLQFFANAQWIIIIADPAAWVFEAVKNYIVSWAGTFAALAGLEQVIKRGEEK
jgi:hypothetical protein